MMRTHIWPTSAVCITLVLGLLLAIAATGDSPAPAKNSGEKEEDEKRPAKSAKCSIPISPGIQALASESTDIIVADVLETNPHEAMEGARDTVKLKVIRTLFGRTTAGDTIGVSYHLLWSDEKREILESRKFAKGKRYVIFLRSQLSRGPDGERIEYELTDRWLSVLPDRAHLIEEVEAAVRVSHGDFRGEWSSTEGSIAGLQGRLVAYREESNNGAPIIAIYLDLRNITGGNDRTEFLLDEAKIEWIVSDATGKAIAPSGQARNWNPTTRPRKLDLDSQKSGRLLLTTRGEFAQRDMRTHFLAAKITLDATRQPDRWSGTLDLSKVPIPPVD